MPEKKPAIKLELKLCKKCGQMKNHYNGKCGYCNFKKPGRNMGGCEIKCQTCKQIIEEAWGFIMHDDDGHFVSCCKCLSDDMGVNAIMHEFGKRGGLKGGPARAKYLTPERRKEIAMKAANARWRNR